MRRRTIFIVSLQLKQASRESRCPSLPNRAGPSPRTIFIVSLRSSQPWASQRANTMSFSARCASSGAILLQARVRQGGAGAACEGEGQRPNGRAPHRCATGCAGRQRGGAAQLCFTCGRRRPLTSHAAQYSQGCSPARPPPCSRMEGGRRRRRVLESGPAHAARQHASSRRPTAVGNRGRKAARLLSVTLATAPFSSSWRKKPRMAQSSLSYSSITKTASGEDIRGSLS